MIVWAWRIASRRGMGNPALRLMATLLAMPAMSTALSMIYRGLPWPTSAGLGGAGGHLLSMTFLDMAATALGPLGGVLVFLAAVVLAAGLGAASLGLSPGEWRAAGRTAAGAVRAGSAGGQAVAGLFARGAGPEEARPRPQAEAPVVWRERATVAADAPPVPREPELPSRSRAPDPEPAAKTPPKILARARVAVPERGRAPAPRQESLPLQEAGWRFPPNSLLNAPPPRGAVGPDEEALQNNARLLESVLSDYGVQGAIRDIRPGPVVTLYELEPAPGIRSARVIGLADDVARSLCVTAVRIATVPGRNVIGIEVPNAKRETVFLSELLESEAWTRHQGRLPIALGKDIAGTPVVSDLARMPHLLIAGTTGSGKSVGINAMILSRGFRI
jgi:S-DNA-T family DNA segregation ATPase FtsK/SpoIIIE